MTEQTYIERICRLFQAGYQDRKLFLRIICASSKQRKQILQNVAKLVKSKGLAFGLLALYRQQVNCGFVLSDPLSNQGKKIKRFKDKKTGIEFRFLWNPDRELRKNHELLIKRGVIAENIDRSKLVNIQDDGKPCYLCRRNIALQNPAEVLLPLRLADRSYYVGANFAYIANNHFTIISAKHRKQAYSRHILAVLIDFVSKTGGYFRAVFNGLAGATIPWHEHLQATTEPFPVENIRICRKDLLLQGKGFRVLRPFYYLPLWVIEGEDKDAVIKNADDIIVKWQGINPAVNTENIIVIKSNGLFRIFIFLRETGRLTSRGKFGAMASFECGGSIVLSYQPQLKQKSKSDEQKTFDNADIKAVRRLLAEIAPMTDVNMKVLIPLPDR